MARPSWMARWCRMVAIAQDGTALGVWLLEGSGLPGLPALAEVAERALEARRAGGRLVLDAATSELAELIELAGLPVEVRRQAEGREQSLGVDEVEEEGHLGDPTI